MKVVLNLSDRFSVEVEDIHTKGVFEQLAAIQGTFEDHKCGLCGGSELQYVVRKVEDNDFYELQCKNFKCKGKLSFGCSKAEPNKLYPKRLVTDNKGKATKDKDGNTVVKGKWGWTRWNPETKTEE